MVTTIVASNGTEPLVIPVKPHLLKRGGRGAIILGVILTGICLIVMVYGAFFPTFLYVFLLAGLLLMLFGGLNIGVGRKEPVALRIDQHGVSGFYVPTLNWTDILRIDRSGKGELGIEFFDRAQVRQRQRDLMWRFNLSLPLGDGWHMVVPGSVLDADLNEVVATAQAFQAAAIARDQRGGRT